MVLRGTVISKKPWLEFVVAENFNGINLLYFLLIFSSKGAIQMRGEEESSEYRITPPSSGKLLDWRKVREGEENRASGFHWTSLLLSIYVIWIFPLTLGICCKMALKDEKKNPSKILTFLIARFLWHIQSNKCFLFQSVATAKSLQQLRKSNCPWQTQQKWHPILYNSASLAYTKSAFIRAGLQFPDSWHDGSCSPIELESITLEISVFNTKESILFIFKSLSFYNSTGIHLQVTMYLEWFFYISPATFHFSYHKIKTKPKKLFF